ncbi:hypothetical protein IQ06DRAFT_37876 [Phaeosphaeriaceae sp. SRC1lsM3a]|nr:hypothetical protein IQ06DRAFT_37876 [Stagonospora sp. SRC1lsM3a]
MATKLLRFFSQWPHTTSISNLFMPLASRSSHHLRFPHIIANSRLRPTYYSTNPHTQPPPSSSRPKSPSPSLTDPSLPSFNLFHLLRTSRPAVRYTVYFGLGLMATVESTFWFHVLKAKFFPAKEQEERAKADELLNLVSEAVERFRGAWMGNYRRYYGGYVWGVGER